MFRKMVPYITSQPLTTDTYRQRTQTRSSIAYLWFLGLLNLKCLALIRNSLVVYTMFRQQQSRAPHPGNMIPSQSHGRADPWRHPRLSGFMDHF